MEHGSLHNLTPRSALVLVFALLCCVNGCTRKFFRVCADREVTSILAEKDRFAFWKIENWHVYPDSRARFADPTNPDHPPKPPDDPSTYYLSPDPQRFPRPDVAWVEGTAYLDILKMWNDGNRALGVKPSLGDAAKDLEITLFKEKPERSSPSLVQAAYRAQEPKQPTVIGLGAPEPSLPTPLGGAESGVQDRSLPSPLGGEGSGVRGSRLPKEFAQKPGEPDKLPDLPELPKPQAVDPQPDAPDKCEQPNFLITLNQAVELGLFNSRDFQTRREDLYLVALPVTTQRFNFAFQWFATENAIRQWTGPEFPGGPLNIWDTNQVVGFSKLFSTGALLLFQFANETVVHLTGGPRHTISESVISLDLIQPLLRGGGRAVTLEPLTQAERDLLYEIRDYARFRKAFYTSIATGGDLDVFNTQPIRQGYLPTLQRIAQLQLQRKNVDALTRLLAKYVEYEKGGIVTQLQVDQVRLQLLSSENDIRVGDQGVFDALDRFKIQLGLPVTINLDLADDPIRPLDEQFERYDKLFTQFTETTKLIEKGFTEPNFRGYLQKLFVDSDFTRGTEFSKIILPFWAPWEPGKLNDAGLLLKMAERNKRLMELTEKAELTEEELSQQRLLIAEQEIGELEALLRLHEAKKLPVTKYPDLLNAAMLVLVQARQEKLIKLHESWPKLPPIVVDGVDLLGDDKQLAEDTVVQTALTTRLDLLNARAQVVDAWRGIRVFANALLGVIDVSYHLDTITPIGEAKPFAFSGHRSQHRLEFNAQAPLVRIIERNEYRAALIVYQRQRRLLMAAEDNIAATVRRQLRQLRVFALNYKVSQEQVALAYNQVDNSEEVLDEPPRPGAVVNAGNAAALTKQVLDAQSSLLRAQREMYGIWINYLATRIQLYRDLELMPLDPRGVWIDELSTDEHSEVIGTACPPGTIVEPRLPAAGFLAPAEQPPTRVPAP